MWFEAARAPVLEIKPFIGPEDNRSGACHFSHGAVDAGEFGTRWTDRRLRHSVLGEPNLTVENEIGVAAGSDFNKGNSFAPAAAQRNREQQREGSYSLARRAHGLSRRQQLGPS